MIYSFKTLFVNLIISLLLSLVLTYVIPVSGSYPEVVLSNIIQGVLVISTVVMIITYVVLLGLGISDSGENLGLYLWDILYFNPALIIQILIITVLTVVLFNVSSLFLGSFLTFQLYYLLSYYWGIYSILIKD